MFECDEPYKSQCVTYIDGTCSGYYKKRAIDPRNKAHCRSYEQHDIDSEFFEKAFGVVPEKSQPSDVELR